MKPFQNTVNFWHNNRGTYYITLAWLGGVSMGIAIAFLALGFLHLAVVAFVLSSAMTACAWVEGRTLDKYAQEIEQPERFLNASHTQPITRRPAMHYWNPKANNFTTITR